MKPNGKGTYSQVARSTAYLAKQIPERFSVTSVLCHKTDPHVVFDAIASLGVKRIELVPAVHHNDSIRPHFEDAERYRAFIRNYAQRYLDAADDEIPATLVRFANIVARIMGYDTRRIPCSAGRSFFGVSPEGDLYPCFRFIGVEPYRTGNLVSGLRLEAIEAFAKGPGRSCEERFPCQECWAAPLCGGPCFACAEMFGPGDGQPIAVNCAYVLADARSAVWLVAQLRKRNPERLLSFLPSAIEIR